MNKIILIMIVLACLLASVSIVSAEDSEWQVVDNTINGVYHGTSDNNQEDNKEEVEPIAHPILDLALSIGVLFSTILICLIIWLPRRIRKYHQRHPTGLKLSSIHLDLINRLLVRCKTDIKVF